MSAPPPPGERIYRKRGREIPALVGELRAVAEAAHSAAARRKWSWLLGLTAITAGVMWLSVAGGVAILMISIVILLFIMASKPARQIEDRIHWLATFLDKLQPELHPRARLWLRMDLRPRDHAKFLMRSTTSSRGRAKKQFRAPWLSIETTLADGTYLTVGQMLVTKTKSGVVNMLQTRLTISGRAHPARYTVFDDKRQRKLIETHLASVLGKFEHSTESHRVKPAKTTRARCAIEVRARQPCTPVETMHLVGALVGAFGEQRADRGTAA